MTTELPTILLKIQYRAAVQAYFRRRSLEHITEGTAQAAQREITLESLALVKTQRSDVHVFNQLLLQYPREGAKNPGQVVPDNMAVLHNGTIKAEASYDLLFQPAVPFWVMEYLSRKSKRKNYQKCFTRYERELKVPYCLLSNPEDQELSLFHHNGRKYVSVKPNEQGRLAIPELEMEVALLDGWVRFWYRGELLPLPADLLKQLKEVEQQLRLAQRQIELEKQRADEEKQRADAAVAEMAQMRAELERLRKNA